MDDAIQKKVLRGDVLNCGFKITWLLPAFLPFSSPRTRWHDYHPAQQMPNISHQLYRSNSVRGAKAGAENVTGTEHNNRIAH